MHTASIREPNAAGFSNRDESTYHFLDKLSDRHVRVKERANGGVPRLQLLHDFKLLIIITKLSFAWDYFRTLRFGNQDAPSRQVLQHVLQLCHGVRHDFLRHFSHYGIES